MFVLGALLKEFLGEVVSLVLGLFLACSWLCFLWLDGQMLAKHCPRASKTAPKRSKNGAKMELGVPKMKLGTPKGTQSSLEEAKRALRGC